MVHKTHNVLLMFLVMMAMVGMNVLAAPVDIEFFFPANQSEAEVWKELVEVFNEKQDQVHVTDNWYTGPGGWGGFQEKVVVRFASETSPDLLRLSDEAFPEWVDKGYLRPVSPFLDRDQFDKSPYLPMAFELGARNGAFYGFPQGIATRALAYNETLFDDAGLLHPGDDWRWDRELLKAAQSLTKPEPEPGTYGIGFWFGGAGVLQKDIPEIVWSFGGEVFDADGSFRLYEDEGMAAIEFLVDLVNNYQVYPADFDIAGRFVRGSLAMWNTGIWDVAYLRQQQGLEWDFAPTPGGPAGHYSFIQGNGIYVIPSQTDDRKAQAAWEFMKFLASEEGQRIFCLKYGIGGIPLVQSLLDQYSEQPAPPDNWDAFVLSVKRGRLYNQPPMAKDVIAALDEGWSDMVHGQLAPRIWVQQVRPKVERLIAQGGR